jgi:hypothetical protein
MNVRCGMLKAQGCDDLSQWKSIDLSSIMVEEKNSVGNFQAPWFRMHSLSVSTHRVRESTAKQSIWSQSA